MTESRDGIGRRDALKVLGLGVLGLAGAAAGKEIIDKVADIQNDLSNEENFREFVGKEVYPAYFKGKAHVRERATIHKEPTYWSEDDDRSLITTQKRRETQISEVRAGDDFSVKRPILIFQEASKGEGGVYIKQVDTPSGEKKLIDIRGSWIVFGLGLTEDIPDYVKDDIQRTPHKVGCVNFQDLSFEPEGGNIQFSFPQEAIEYRQEINLGL